MYRNNKVFSFRLSILDLAHEYVKKHNYSLESKWAYSWYDAILPSYNTMLYSFKPLELKYWVDETTINKLMS